ncbi:DUF6508 domain-containing protein [Kineococcus sp. SYSU DK005]|uniref:DUF6508 domain-containing protein n=1 Tax=Kineococcus sp. SYSU DK005 TaxID=3383126 RepID=UPI003D7E45AB
MQQPSDADYEAVLAAVPEQLWREIEQSLRALPESTAGNEWKGGHETRPGVRHLPYVQYSPGIELLRTQLNRSGVLLPHDWVHWHGRSTYTDAASMRQAPVADAVRYLVGLLRNERFNEGAIDAELRVGRVAAALENMSAWRQQHTGDHADAAPDSGGG